MGRPGRRLSEAHHAGPRLATGGGGRISDHMRLLLIGAPGSGKGTQAELLARRFGIAHISSGDLLRQHVTDLTSLGPIAKRYGDDGAPVPGRPLLDMLPKP